MPPAVPWRLPGMLRHAQRLLSSDHRWTGQNLVAAGTAHEQARRLFEAPFVVLSHGLEADPVLNYGNHAALARWEMDWEPFTRTPSRLLERVAARGYCDDYRGVRVSSTGRRFLIEGAMVWNLLDELGAPAGQAALFRQWRELEPGRHSAD